MGARLGQALEDGTTTVVASDVTGPAGTYSLSLPAAVYDLRVTPATGSGFGEETVQNVEVSGDRTFDVILISQGGGGGGSGSVSGFVSGRDGEPLADVEVYAFGPAGEYGDTTTDADGLYSLANLSAGNYFVQIQPLSESPFAPQSFYCESSDVDVDASGVTVVDFPLGVVEVTGTVTGSDGTLLQGASVGTSSNFFDSNLYCGSSEPATSAVDGTYAVRLLAGNAYFSAHPPAGAPFGPVSLSNVLLADDSVVDLVLPAAIDALQGTVTGRDGEPLADVEVFAYSYAGQSGGASTDADGFYSIPNLTAGSYFVQIQTFSESPFAPQSFYCESSDVDVASVTVVDFPLGVVEVTGTVTGSDGTLLQLRGAVRRGFDQRRRLLQHPESDGGQLFRPDPIVFGVALRPGVVLLRALRLRGQRHDGRRLRPRRGERRRPGGRLQRCAGTGDVSANAYSYGSETQCGSSANLTSDAFGEYSQLLLAGNASFYFAPPPASGFAPTSLNGVDLSGDLTQAVILQLPDFSPPVIVSGPTVIHLSDTSVSINWTTNEASDSEVELGIGSLTDTVFQGTLEIVAGS